MGILQLTKEYIFKFRYNLIASYKRIMANIEVPINNNGHIIIKSINTIKFKNVSFSYRNKDVINNFNYKFHKGNMYCVIENNGMEKSILLNLMCGFSNESYKGNIYYNSVDIVHLDLYHIRNNLIGIADKKPSIICDTVFNNIAKGTSCIDAEKLNYFLGKFNLKEFVKKLSNGMNSNIFERGGNITSVEKKKISLASVFMKNTKVVILDEPTADLDLGSVKNLKDIINKMKKDKIIIIFTKDKKMISIADEVIDFTKI